jgi:hypothetical protein
VYETVRPWLRAELAAPVNLPSMEHSLPSLSLRDPLAPQRAHPRRAHLTLAQNESPSENT